MSGPQMAMRPLASWKAALRHARISRRRTTQFVQQQQQQQQHHVRPLSTVSTKTPESHEDGLVEQPQSIIESPLSVFTSTTAAKAQQRLSPYVKPPTNPSLKHIPILSSPPSIHSTCPTPLQLLDARQIAALDPTGARSRLFDKLNPEAAKVGDILLVRLRTGEPFAGVLLNIRRRGAESAILLRNTLTRIGVECWYKFYSPNVDGIEVVQRREKRARRARLYYMRQPRHDIGSVENIVRQYLRNKAALGSGDGGRPTGQKGRAGGKKKGRK